MIEKTLTANLEYYKVFYQVARLGNLTAAAEHLCLTQPTVTKAVQNLEQQLNCQLFVRTKRGMRLTQEGKVLWNRVEPACHLLMAAEQELASIQALDRGTLSIASTEMSFRTYVLPVMEQFTQDYPNVKVRFRNALTNSILEMLRTGEIDFAILHRPFPTDDHMEVREIGKIEECFVTGPRYAFLAEQTLTLSELQKYPFISVPEGSATKQYAAAVFHHHGLEYEPDMEVTTIELVLQSVKRNFGIAMLPWEVVQDSVARGELYRIPIDLPPMEREACVITHKDMQPGPAARAFLSRYLPVEINQH